MASYPRKGYRGSSFDANQVYSRYHVANANLGYPVAYANAAYVPSSAYAQAYGHPQFSHSGPNSSHYEGDEKLRQAYPYVPTAFSHHSDPGGGGLATAGGDAADSPKAHEQREHWGSQWEFVFSCVGLSVGIGNVWRFPYLAYENGGGAFLLPYFILLLVVGKPMYFMETALGQFTQRGPVSIWGLAPVGRGVGFAMCTVSLIVSIYYNVVMGYCLHYIYNSFAWVLPWKHCGEWTDAKCYARLNNETCDLEHCQTASEQYWQRHVLGAHLAPSMQYTEEFNSTSDVLVNRTYVLNDLDLGAVKWDLALPLSISWLVVFLCLSKGIRSSGKIVYFTATFPYVVLAVLLVRGLMMEGAIEGVKFFLLPKWDRLLDVRVWRQAAEQVFFSLSVSWGGLIMFGSYNRFETKVHRIALAVSSLDFLTSIMGSIAVFSVLGGLQHRLGLPHIEDVVQQKQGLAFVVYPEAVLLLPLPQLWSVLFFFMLFTLGLDTQFALLETVFTAIYDTLPSLRSHKAKVSFLICLICFVLSLPCVTYSGQYVFDIMDTYGGGLSVVWVAIFETAVIMWIYGPNNFAHDLEFMLRTKVYWPWKVLWSVIPVVLALIFFVACFFWKTPVFEQVHYSEWAHIFGWTLTLIVFIQIPVGGLLVLAWHGVAGDLLGAFRADCSWGPGDPAQMQEWRAFKSLRKRAKTSNQNGMEQQNYAMSTFPYQPQFHHQPSHGFYM